MTDDADLIPVFMPALSAVLISSEDDKEEPLNRDEVLELRDGAACMMMELSVAKQLTESRGYTDLDPDNCWYEWQLLRRELGRKPDLDLGVKLNLFSEADPAYQATIVSAQQSLHLFRKLLPQFESSSAMVKTVLDDGVGKGRVWLTDTRQTESGFSAELFEIPDSISGFAIGDSFEISSDDVLDWMINDSGTLHGGFSLRYHRSNLPEHERDAYDHHIGITSYDA